MSLRPIFFSGHAVVQHQRILKKQCARDTRQEAQLLDESGFEFNAHCELLDGVLHIAQADLRIENRADHPHPAGFLVCTFECRAPHQPERRSEYERRLMLSGVLQHVILASGPLEDGTHQSLRSVPADQMPVRRVAPQGDGRAARQKFAKQ